MEIRKLSVLVTLTVSIILAACSPTLPTTGIPQNTLTTFPIEIETNTPSALPTEISTQPPTIEPSPDDSLKNGTYIIDGQPITLVDGVAETELAPGSASKQVTRFFGNQMEIDLNSDGLMDSVFIIQQENGGSGTFYFVVAALKNTDGYLGTNAIFLGDRIAPQTINIDPNNPSQFIVNYSDRNADEPMSSPPSVGVSRIFKLENGSLIEVVIPTTQTP